MLKTERQNYIMDLIKRQRYVRVMELKDLLNVSDETIRRDLSVLEKKGLLHCVHGGAVYDSSSVNEYHVNIRMRQNQAEKDAVCRTAASLIHEGESLTVAASTTTAYLGEYLEKKNGLTLVTNSVLLANKVSFNESNHVILAGGDFWNEEQKTMGAMAVAEIEKFNVDAAFISVSGITAEKGLTEYREAEAELTRAVIRGARRVILLNDYTKFDFTAFRQVAPTDRIHDIVTDWHTPTAVCAQYEQMGICVHRARKP